MSSRESTPNSESPVGTLNRGLSILQLIASTGEVTPTTVAANLSTSRSTTYRIIEALRDAGFVETNPATSCLRLGIKAIELGMAALAEVDVIAVAPPCLRGLAAATFETVFLAVLNNDEMVYVLKEESALPVRMSCALGSRRPLHSTGLGKAYLSALPEADRQELIGRLDLVQFTENTITDPQQLEAEVTKTLIRGYAFDNVEGEEGVSCLAAPVRDFTGLPVAAISVSGPTERIVARYTEIGDEVASTATLLSRRLGYVSRDQERSREHLSSRLGTSQQS